MGRVETNTSRFLNVDLELRSRGDIDALLAALRDDVVILHDCRRRGMHFVTMELYAPPRSPVSERYVLKWLGVIQKLSPAARRKWRGCTLRRLDVGVDAGAARYGCSFQPTTLAALAKAALDLAFTVYGENPDR